MFIPQAALNEVKQRAIVPVKPHVDKVSLHYMQLHDVWKSPTHIPSFCLLQQFTSNANHHAVRKWRLEARLGEFVKHLGHSQTVILPQVVEKTQSMVLWREIILLETDRSSHKTMDANILLTCTMMLSLEAASWASLTQRFTTSKLIFTMCWRTNTQTEH